MPMPPPDTFAARFFLGPALRSQSDRRLVTLVRDGYEAAFEEIVRRYGGPLGRYAGAIVGGSAEDVTQDAFSKALQALRRDDREIELRPWLYRIVRNTALNDLRDRPPTPEALAEALAGGRSAAEEVEHREELKELVERLRALPEPQRAAIVMRELEGLSHAEIAAALGLSGGGARQTIHRARQALRNAAGMMVPLPLLKALLKALLAAGTMGPTEMAAGAAGAGGVAGAGVALKAATATVLVAGAVGAGVAIHENRQPNRVQGPASAESPSSDSSRSQSAFATHRPANDDGSSGNETGDDRGRGNSESGDGHGQRGDESGEDHGKHSGEPGGDDGNVAGKGHGDQGGGTGDDHSDSGRSTGDHHDGGRTEASGHGGGGPGDGGGSHRGPSQPHVTGGHGGPGPSDGPGVDGGGSSGSGSGGGLGGSSGPEPGDGPTPTSSGPGSGDDGGGSGTGGDGSGSSGGSGSGGGSGSESGSSGGSGGGDDHLDD
jgi:RNA polymerase sigma factor (sigma-70 family)